MSNCLEFGGWFWQSIGGVFFLLVILMPFVIIGWIFGETIMYASTAIAFIAFLAYGMGCYHVQQKHEDAEYYRRVRKGLPTDPDDVDYQ